MRSLVRDAGLDGRVQICSAGTGRWHVGEPADERAVGVLTQHGYDASGHRARHFAKHWFADHDLVVAVDGENLTALRRIAPQEQASKLRLLREFDPDASADLDVPDPYYGGTRGFRDVLEMIERSCLALLEHVRQEHGW